ncbi:MAG: Ig-like domain-containing protein [Alcanivorax sp.]|nr:Ig-like domain-containing protein [Alcanivorax sp.]
MKKHLIISAVALGLVACGSDEATVGPSPELEASRQGLMYAYPAHEQVEVPTPAPIVLRFSSPVMDSNPEMFITLRDAAGDEVPYSIETGIGDGQGLVLTPNERLTPRSQYSVEIDGITLEKGDAQPRTLTFTTKGLSEGPRALVTGAPDGSGNFDNFELLRKIPDGTSLPILDFSSFRLQFNQPLDRTTVNYGSSVALEGPDGVVDAHLIVHGPYMTVDPKEDLTPGVEYTLSLQSDITSTYGETFASNSYTFTPLDSGSRSVMTQEVAAGTNVSMLTGKPVNMVPLEAVLLGDDNQTQQSGFLQAELAHIPSHPDFVPLRIKRGSMLSGTDMEVLIGGEVPSGFSSGEVKIHFISDAVGYLEENPYSEADNARRQLRLFMDVAITAEDPRANGAVTQDLMHLELIGTAEIRDGRLTADAVSVAEPRVLGSEDARSVLSFFMQSEVGGNATDIAYDSLLEIQSWSPGEDLKGFLPSEPAIIRFNRPVDMDDIQSLVTVRENGQLIDVGMRTSGSSLVITPEQGFKRSVQTAANGVDRYEYTIELSAGLADMLGGTLGVPHLFEFEMPVEVTLADQYQWQLDPMTGAPSLIGPDETDVTVRSPMITSVYPGYPCALADIPVDLASGMTANCRGGLEDIYHRLHHVVQGSGNQHVQHIPHKLPDDILPLTRLPANRPVIAIFTKPIAAESVVLGQSFKVETVDEWGGGLEEVPGQVSVDGRKVTFWPEEPWEVDTFYRYVLGSNGDRHSSAATCDGSQAICSVDGLPIQTQLHEITLMQHPGSERRNNPDARLHDLLYQDANAPDGGGVDLVQYFKGGESTKQVLQVLNTPSVDTNANLIHDRNSDARLDLTPRPYFYLDALPFNMYTVEEDGAENQPPLAAACSADDPNCYDPDGLLPPWNSTKILPGVLQPADVGEEVCDPSDPDCRDLPYCDVTNPYCQYLIPVVNIGCGITISFGGTFDLEACPEDKFTYITSDLIAEVGEYDDALGGVPVTIWPGQIMATSLPMTAPLQLGPGITYGFDSGAQVMRMRYAKHADDTCEESAEDGRVCVRDQPIQAVITQRVGSNGESYPHISTTLDVYVDAIGLEENIEPLLNLINQTALQGRVTSDMTSVPVTLELEGEVYFNDDGTMRVEMENTNMVEIGVGIKGLLPFDNQESESLPMSWSILEIPEGGTRVQYLSEIIK